MTKWSFVPSGSAVQSAISSVPSGEERPNKFPGLPLPSLSVRLRLLVVASVSSRREVSKRFYVFVAREREAFFR